MNLLITYFSATAGLFAQTVSGWAKPHANGASAAAVEASRGPVSSVFEAFATTTDGLTDQEAAHRLITYGPNAVAHERTTPWALMLLNNFRNPFILVLIVLGAVSYATGDLRGTVVVAVMVAAVSVVMRFFQEFRSSQAAEALRAMVRTTATVTRRYTHDDESDVFVPDKREVPFEELVPGDIVHLSAGDMIPADARLITSKDLFVGQSALSGEAMPVEKYDTLAGVVEKSADDASSTTTNALDHANLCFMGTNPVGAVVTNASSRCRTPVRTARCGAGTWLTVASGKSSGRRFLRRGSEMIPRSPPRVTPGLGKCRHSSWDEGGHWESAYNGGVQQNGRHPTGHSHCHAWRALHEARCA